MGRYWLLLCAALLCGQSAYAQQAQLSGLITDPSSAAVPQALVLLRNQASGVRYVTSSNGAGVYTFPFVKPGSYEVTVEKAGFKTLNRREIQLAVDQNARIDFTLQVGSVPLSINVTAGTVVVNLTPALGGEITTRMVVNLPLNGRDYTQLVTLSPGATLNPYSRAGNGFSLNGGVTLQTQMLIDGTDNTN
jgi:hypothetical protein